jgi:MGT family glycosyltransferase
MAAATFIPRSFLFALTDGGGTVPPELGVARRLVERGHRVCVLAEASMQQQVHATGAEFVAWTESWGQFQDWNLRTPVSQLRGMVDSMLLGPAEGQVRDTTSAIERARPDLVVASFPAIGAMVAAESHRVAFDVLIPNVYALPAKGMPPFGVGLRPARGPLGHRRDRVARRLSTAMFDRFALQRITTLRAQHGLAATGHAWDQLHHAQRELVLTSAAFDFPATLPRNVRYVGPILDDPTWASGDDWSAPAGDDPLVLVALSSTFQNQRDSIQRIVDALHSLPVRAVVTTGPAIRPETIRAAPNVAVVSSAPHGEVLKRCSVVVTHGGHGTVLKALAAGVPLVLLPHGRDQADNAVRVTTRGAGITLPRRAAPRRIAAAVTDVLAVPAYRNAATELGTQIASDAKNTTVVAELELQLS